MDAPEDYSPAIRAQVLLKYAAYTVIEKIEKD